jgi:hypothetical protein
MDLKINVTALKGKQDIIYAADDNGYLHKILNNLKI